MFVKLFIIILLKKKRYYNEYIIQKIFHLVYLMIRNDLHEDIEIFQYYVLNFLIFLL